MVVDVIRLRDADVFVYKRQGVRVARLEALGQGSYCTIMVLIGREME